MLLAPRIRAASRPSAHAFARLKRYHQQIYCTLAATNKSSSGE
jgi:hypothetical protein